MVGIYPDFPRREVSTRWHGGHISYSHMYTKTRPRRAKQSHLAIRRDRGFGLRPPGRDGQ